MNKKQVLIILLITITTISLIFVMPSFAGPGGKIAKVIATTLLGKVILAVLTIIFLPLILYVWLREKLAERRTLKDLAFMAKYSPNFEWLRAKERILDCFYRIHRAWSTEDVSEASEYMSDWYWQNQQLVYLEKWKREGLYNECEVKKIQSIRPLLFVHRNDDSEHEGSLLIVSITARMKDFLVKRNTNEVVEGDKKFKDNETVWSFTLIDNKWRVSNIEESDFSLGYAGQIKYLPKIEDTLISENVIPAKKKWESSY
ncbi:NTF2-like domain-containing protein [Desulfonema limicola]|uniref:NTF2-like domain-containing protein n=1 Tax=Desulfonema limicola TaxID=45656 RepID=A0A975B6Q4_9BACT|nr:Tim44-like domain-containing protein [Desulfonema limicola]QTA79794.1 NTF2-like domain-containing protein [Desulfonema limicola]